MKLLVVGSGGREHAIAKNCLSQKSRKGFCCSWGMMGMTLDGLDLVNISISEHSKID